MKRAILKKQSETEWARVDAMKDEAINYSDNPKLGSEFFKKAIWWPGPKKQITLRLDPDILKFFKRKKRYQTTINAVLRKYVEAQKGRSG